MARNELLASLADSAAARASCVSLNRLAFWIAITAWSAKVLSNDICLSDIAPASEETTARDLTQEFFARLLEGHWLRPADPERGRFRSFLLRCLSRFLVDDWRRRNAQKRGGGMSFFSLDQAREENNHLEPADPDTPERAYDRHWAEAVVARAHDRLRNTYVADGQLARFEALQIYLADGQEPASYAEVAQQLSLTVSAVRSAIYKIRQRYGDAVRVEIAETVSRPDEIETELNHLLEALG